MILKKLKEKSNGTKKNERKRKVEVNKKRKSNIFLVSKYTYITLKRIMQLFDREGDGVGRGGER